MRSRSIEDFAMRSKTPPWGLACPPFHKPYRRQPQTAPDVGVLVVGLRGVVWLQRNRCQLSSVLSASRRTRYAVILESVMRTTISIDDKLMAELMRSEPDVSQSEALRRAVKSHLQQKRIDAFMQLAGSRLVDLDWREMERIDMKDAERRHSERHGRTRSRAR